MKKFLFIGLLVAIFLIVAGGAGMVYARVSGIDNTAFAAANIRQNGDEVFRQFGYGPGGMMGGSGNGYAPGGMMGGYGPGGMMGGPANGYGPGMMGGRGLGIARGAGIMRDYMLSAFAEAVDLTVEDVETRLADGETFKEIAIAQGTAEADLPELVAQVHQAALDQAVADGVITQAQADLMLEHMNNYQGEGFGPGFGFNHCPLSGGDDLQP